MWRHLGQSPTLQYEGLYFALTRLKGLVGCAGLRLSRVERVAYRGNAAPMKRPVLMTLCLAITAAAVPWSHGEHTVWARTFEAVTVTGNRFVPDDDILYACDLAPGQDYEAIDIEVREACLKSTEMFESVAIRPEGANLVVEVEEVELRPGRMEFSIAYDTQDQVVGSVYFERYNLFPDTFGSVELRLTDEVGSLESSLYYSGFGEDGPDADAQAFGEAAAMMKAAGAAPSPAIVNVTISPRRRTFTLPG
mgnify:CR=1 FL=1